MKQDSSATARSPIDRRFRLILVGLVVVMIAWSIGWFAVASYAKGRIDAVLARPHDGVRLTCANRSLAGFPFRLELRCGPGSLLTTPDGKLDLTGLTLLTQVYDPTKFIAELEPPVDVASPLGTAHATWSLAHASAALGHRALDRFSVEVRKPVLSASVLPGQLAADNVQLHGRHDPNVLNGLDFALIVAGLQPPGGGAPVDVKSLATLHDAAPLFAGKAAAVRHLVAEKGVVVDLTDLEVDAGKTIVSAGGTLTLSPAGTVNGKLDVAVAGAAAALPIAGWLGSDAGAQVGKMLDGALAFARSTEIEGRPAKAFTVTIDNSVVRLGILPLGKLPPIRLASG